MASNVTPTTGADAMARFNEYLAKMQAAQGVTPGPTVRPRMTAPAPQQGGSMGGGIPMSTSVALGKYIGSQIFGQAAAPAIMANVPAAPVMASALGGAAPATSGLGALSSGSGLATGSARRHAQRAVQADHLAVEHVVLKNMQRQLGIVLRRTQARGEGHGGPSRVQRRHPAAPARLTAD